MKFLGSSIPTVDFGFVLGHDVGGYPYADTLKKIVHIDQSIEYIDFGSRKEKIASLKIVRIGATNYKTILDYLLNNSGKKIQIEQSDGEDIFGVNIPSSGTSFYAYVLDVAPTGEYAYTDNNNSYDITINISYSGDGINDKYNPDNTSLIDFLIEVESNSIGIQYQSTLITDLALLSPSNGDLSYCLENKRIYYYYSSAWNIVDIDVNLKSKMIDNSSIGLSHGVFRWSSFSTITRTEPYYNKFLSDNGINLSFNVTNTFLSGVTNKESIVFPTSNISIEKGASVENPQGFSFSIDNSQRLSKCMTKYNFFGARSSIYVYDNAGSADRKVLIRSGINKQNEFDYFKIKFNIEPKLLFDKNLSIPNKTLENSDLLSITNYVTQENKDLNVPQTFGRWKYARLQPVVFDNKQIEANTNPTGDIWDTSKPLLLKNQFRILQDPSESDGYQWILIDLSAKENDDVFTLIDSGNVFISILYGGSGASGTYLINNVFKTDIGADIVFLRILLSNKIDNLVKNDRIELISRSVKFIVDEEECKGFSIDSSNPKIYTFNENTNSYEKYADGIFVVENDFTSIESTTQIKMNNSIFRNGLTSLDDTKINVFDANADWLQLDVINSIKVGEKIPDDLEFGMDNTNLDADYFSLLQPPDVIPSIPNDKQIFRKISGSPDSYDSSFGYLGLDVKNKYRGNFGLNAKYPTNHACRLSMLDSFYWNQARFIMSSFDQTNEMLRYNIKANSGTKGHFYRGVTISRFIKVDEDLRTKLFGAENVSLLLSQEFGCYSPANITETWKSNVNGMFVVVDVILNDNTILNAFSGRFGDTLEKTRIPVGSLGHESRIVFSNKPTWLGGYIDSDFLSTAGTVTSSTGLTVFTGGDMITLNSSLFDSVSYLFGNAIGINISFTFNTNLTSSEITEGKLEGFGDRFHTSRIQADSDPDRANQIAYFMYLSYDQQFDLSKKTFYAKLDGGLIDGSNNIIETPEAIAEKFMSKNNLTAPSFTALNRDNYKLRSQYFENITFGKFLSEFAENSFSSAVISPDGSINFKSLDQNDYTNTVFDFDYSTIVLDSFSNVKLRRNNEIINKFIFNYHYDHALERLTKQIIIDLNDDGTLNVDGFKIPENTLDDGLRDSLKDSLITELEPFMAFSKAYLDSGTKTVKSIDLSMYYDEFLENEDYQPIYSLKEIILKIVKYFIFNSWEFSFKVPMHYLFYNANVNNANNALSEHDYISCYINDRVAYGFIKGIKPDFYNGMATITMYSITPPDTNLFYDTLWDGGFGAIDNTEYTMSADGLYPFKDPLQVGTYPDGGFGAIDNTEYQFTDDTFADPDEDYNPFDFDLGESC